MKSTILGILAYGSLLKNPGKELQEHIIERIPVETPFAVEYARSSSGRSGAPTLVPVPSDKGRSVKAFILVLGPSITEAQAHDMLYRREINKIGDRSSIYNDTEQRSKKDAVVIEKLKDFNSIPVILYTSLKANISRVSQGNASPEDKVSELVSLAINSVTKDTFSSHRDGIQYLSDAICCGVETSLTNLYIEEILRNTGNASDLTEARLWVAKNKGLEP